MGEGAPRARAQVRGRCSSHPTATQHAPRSPQPATLIFDAHLDLAMNALEWNRDLTRPIEEIRRARLSSGQAGPRPGTVCFPDMRRGGIGLCVAT